MRNIYLIIVSLLIGIVSIIDASAQSIDQKLAKLFERPNQKVMVAAHRGDWRNAPENSLIGLQNCINKGYDIVELDVRLTKDGELVVMHDNTINRTTNGKGNVSDYTLEELKKFRLINGLGMQTRHQIPTLKEMMLAAKGKVIVNVDKGDAHLSQVFKVLENTATLGQAIVNVPGNTLYNNLKLDQIKENAYIMVVVNMKNADALTIIKSYEANKKAIIQPLFDTDTLSNLKTLPTIAKKQVLWLNSLWASLNGGHDDDTAVELRRPDESWGWLLHLKPSILQTDRLVELSHYLKTNKFSTK